MAETVGVLRAEYWPQMFTEFFFIALVEWLRFGESLT